MQAFRKSSLVHIFCGAMSSFLLIPAVALANGNGLVLGSASVAVGGSSEDYDGGETIDDTSLALNLTLGGNIESYNDEISPVVDFNLVFEDGEEVKGTVAVSAFGSMFERGGYSRGSYRFFTLSATRLNGLVEKVVEDFEQDYDKTIVRLDLFSVSLRERSRPYDPQSGSLVEFRVGLTGASGQIGYAPSVSDKHSLEAVLDLGYETDGLLDSVVDTMNVAEAGLTVNFSYYFTNRVHGKAFIGTDWVRDFDSKVKESAVFAGAELRYYID